MPRRVASRRVATWRRAARSLFRDRKLALNRGAHRPRHYALRNLCQMCSTLHYEYIASAKVTPVLPVSSNWEPDFESHLPACDRGNSGGPKESGSQFDRFDRVSLSALYWGAGFWEPSSGLSGGAGAASNK